MKRLALIAALSAVALPAMAQNYTSYQLGDRTYHQGSDGTTGSSYRLGDRVYSNFSSPNGQSTSCSTYQLGDRLYTNCQ